MDPTLYCEVTLDDDQEESDAGIHDLTEEDIVLLDSDYSESPKKNGLKRPQHGNGFHTPPAKKACRPSSKFNNKISQGVKSELSRNPHSPNKLTPQAANLLKSPHLSVSRTGSPQKSLPPATKPKLQQSITWKYRQLAENQYTADIKKGDIRKNYEPEQCNCARAVEGSTACGSSCINRSTYSECDKEMCVNGAECTNMAIQKRQYAPGLERFMTAKKGWGVRARQSVAKGSFILEYTGEICSSQEFQKRMMDRYKGDSHHYCLAMDNKTMIDAHRAGSECRFVNHSCAPNSEMEKWNVDGLSRMALFALRDILPGEEICYDYNFSLFNTDQGQECKCGAKECRGVIGGRGKDYIITLDSQEPPQVEKTPKFSKTVINPRIAEDESWFNANLSPEDADWIMKNAPKPGQLEAKTIKCTVCNECLNFKALSQCQRHPDLGVVICMKCRGVYGRGGWEKDPEGNDEFCRWCSEGGQIYLCDFCPHAFCNRCLRWNLGRKYLKKIEEEEKWKCLMCDTSHLREHRALYWGIYKYHKDKPAKSKSTPVSIGTPIKGSNTFHGGKQKSVASLKKPQLNGVKPVIKPKLMTNVKAAPPSSINSGYKKLQKNGAINVAPVNPGQTKNNAAKEGSRKKDLKQQPKDFVDIMLADADECIKQFANMVGEVRKKWKHSQKKTVDIAIVTKKLRNILDLAKHNIAEVDQKVVDSYRSNLDTADVSDISLEDIVIEKSKEVVPAIHVKGDEIEDDVVTLESTSDMTCLDENSADTDACEKLIDEFREYSILNGLKETLKKSNIVDSCNTERINDMSVEEIDVEDEEEGKKSLKSDETSITESLTKSSTLTDVKVEETESEIEPRNISSDLEPSSCSPDDKIRMLDRDVDPLDGNAFVKTEEVKEKDTKKSVESSDLTEEKNSDCDESVIEKSHEMVSRETNLMTDSHTDTHKKNEVMKVINNLEQESEVMSKEVKLLSIQFKDEASPIKDQKDIIKEKKAIVSDTSAMDLMKDSNKCINDESQESSNESHGKSRDNRSQREDACNNGTLEECNKNKAPEKGSNDKIQEDSSEKTIHSLIEEDTARKESCCTLNDPVLDSIEKSDLFPEKNNLQTFSEGPVNSDTDEDVIITEIDQSGEELAEHFSDSEVNISKLNFVDD